MKTVTQNITDVCEFIPNKVEGKKHGAWNYYIDDKIKVGLDTYFPNMDVEIMLNGKWVSVYSRSGHGDVNRYNPGAWESYLDRLGDQARKVKERRQIEHEVADREDQRRRYGPISDAALFT